MMPIYYLNIHANMKRYRDDCVGILVPWLVNSNQSDCSIGGFLFVRTPPYKTLFSEAIVLNSE